MKTKFVTRVKFTAPFMGVVVEPDKLTLNTFDPKASIEIPMFYCAFDAHAEIDDDDACTAVVLNICDKPLYMDDKAPVRGHSRMAFKVRDVGMDAWRGDPVLCHCGNADLCINILKILSAIDYLDSEYLAVHGDDMAVIRRVSRTACLTARARAIVDKRYEKIRERREL